MWGIEATKSLTDLQRTLSVAIKRLLDRADATDAAIAALPSAINYQPQIDALKSYKSVTSAYTILPSDSVIECSGASFVVTLPTAIGVTGKEYTIIHNGTHLTQTYTLNTTAGQNIGGVPSGSYILFTTGESLKIVSNGSNWRIVDHYAETDWVDSGAVVIAATVTNPTKATTRTRDNMYWKRSGRNVYIKMFYKQGATTGAAAGSGGYLYAMPSNMPSIDTAITGANTSANINAINQVLGSATISNNSIARPGMVMVYSATQFTLWGYILTGDTYSRVGNTTFALNAEANIHYSADFVAPITLFQP